jgi:hypothetical protein
MDLLNEILNFHISANTVTLRDIPIHILLNAGIVSAYCRELDVYAACRCLFNRMGNTQYRTKTGILLPTTICFSYMLWLNKGIIHNIDNDDSIRGYLLPAGIKPNGEQLYCVNGKVCDMYGNCPGWLP